jgi:hypothetical protein
MSSSFVVLCSLSVALRSLSPSRYKAKREHFTISEKEKAYIADVLNLLQCVQVQDAHVAFLFASSLTQFLCIRST